MMNEGIAGFIGRFQRTWLVLWFLIAAIALTRLIFIMGGWPTGVDWVDARFVPGEFTLWDSTLLMVLGLIWLSISEAYKPWRLILRSARLHRE